MISLDRRWLPGESEAQLMRELRALLRRRGLTASIQRIRDATCEPLATDPRQPLVGRFLGCAGQSAPASVDFFSDAGVFSAARTPSVLFGPGDIAQAHTPDEWIEIDQVEQAKNHLRRFLETLP
jgi:acetylornithine deacetylase